ncbi:acyl carrier protein [Kitasatospora phosalacinea]|uniref:acyl carrier protein n=1 Tax=Kitasatospora phosalacinea TaxID=2065 RepID=UPI00068DCCA0|nr:acyl carrier protein [Kitasatospora phosalacinea]
MSESALPTAALPAEAPPTGAPPAAEPVDPEVRARIRRGIEDVLPRVLGVELADVPENACFFDDFGLTSSGIVELVLDIEETLAIQVDVEHLVIDDVRSVDSLTDYVVGHHVDED